MSFFPSWIECVCVLFHALIMTSKSNFVESLRNIRTALSFFVGDPLKPEFKSFLISSIHPSEGKTFTSINLSRIVALSGKKVLLVDFDMHKPKIHKILKLDNEKGNSNFLSGMCSISETIKQLDDK